MLRSQDAVERFLIRALPPQEFLRIRVSEPCIVTHVRVLRLSHDVSQLPELNVYPVGWETGTSCHAFNRHGHGSFCNREPSKEFEKLADPT